jgi:hypothetical protein
MIIDGCQHHFAQPLSLNQMAKFADHRLVVEIKTEAEEAFLAYGGPAQRLNGRCETESEKQ